MLFANLLTFGIAQHSAELTRYDTIICNKLIVTDGERMSTALTPDGVRIYHTLDDATVESDAMVGASIVVTHPSSPNGKMAYLMLGEHINLVSAGDRGILEFENKYDETVVQCGIGKNHAG